MTPPPAEQLASRLFAGPALRTQPDRRLVALVRQGYEAAFEEIVRRYAKPLGRYAAAIVGGRAEDVIQDAFSKALLALRRDGAEIELRPWLYRIVRNTALNDLRDQPPAAAALTERVPDGRGPADQLERREELAELTARLRALPEPQRAAIVMRELEGLGHEEIAAALGMSGGAARQAIYRARRALREGVGALLPLPLLESLLAGGSAGPVEAAAGGVAGAAGSGLALKAGAATMLVAGVVGAGAALHRDHGVPVPAAAAARTRPDTVGGSVAATEPAGGGRRSALPSAHREADGSRLANASGAGRDGGESSRRGEDRRSASPADSPSGRGGGGGGGDSEPGGGTGDGGGGSGGDSSRSADSGETRSGGDTEGSRTDGASGSGSGAGSSPEGGSGDTEASALAASGGEAD